MNLRLFFRKLTVFTMIVAVLSAVIFYLIPKEYISPTYPYLVLFFYLASLAIYSFLSKSIGKRPAVFLNNFLLVTVLKLFLLIIFLFFYIYFNRDDAIPFVLGFFVLYVAYTSVEVIEIMHLLKNNTWEKKS